MQFHRQPQQSLYLVWVVCVTFLCFILLKPLVDRTKLWPILNFLVWGLNKICTTCSFMEVFWYPFLECANFFKLAPPQQTWALPYGLQVWRAQEVFLILTISHILQSARWHQCLVCGSSAKDAPTPAITATTLCFESLEDWIIICNFPEVLIFIKK